MRIEIGTFKGVKELKTSMSRKVDLLSTFGSYIVLELWQNNTIKVVLIMDPQKGKFETLMRDLKPKIFGKKEFE